MMNAHVANLLNEQINKEFYSAYLYLDFANYFERIGLAGFAHYFKVQAQEERDHALMFYQYLQDSDQPVTLEAIARPDSRLGDRMEPLRQALEHEEFVTASINAIYAAAAAEQDYRTLRFLDWFINEQAEEEKSARDLIAKMEQFGSDAQAGSICWIRSWPLESTPPRYRHDPLPLSFTAFRKGLRFCPEAFLLSPESGIFLAFLSLY